MQFAPAIVPSYALSPSRRPSLPPRSVEPGHSRVGPLDQARLTMVSQIVTRRVGRVLTCMVKSIPATPAGLLVWEQRLHQVVGSELDLVTAAAVQAAHNSDGVREQVRGYVKSIPGLVVQEKAKAVQVTLLGGTRRTVSTPYYLQRADKLKAKHKRRRAKGKRGKAGNGCYPVLAVIGVHERVTPALASEVARLAVLGTYQETQASLRERGISLDVKQVSKLAGSFAQRCLAYRSWCNEQTGAGHRGTGLVRGKRLAIGVDGGRARILETPKRGRRKSGRRGFKAPWREPKVFIIYEIDHLGKKRHLGQLRQDATLKDADGLFALLASTLRQLGAQEAREWVFVGDGAEWIWNRLPELVSAVGYSLEKVTQVVDFYHAVEHLSAVAAYVKGAKQRQDWMREAKRLLRWGFVDQVIKRIRSLCRGRKAKTIAKGIKYFEDHASRMSYAWPASMPNVSSSSTRWIRRATCRRSWR